MDAYEATKMVLSRIQNLDPENATKIMGLLMIRGHGEKEMIRLAFGPESLVHSVVLDARKELGLAPNSPPAPPSPSPAPFIPLSRQNSSSSSRLGGSNLPSPLSIPNQSWAPAYFSDLQSNEDLISPNNFFSASTFYGTDLVDELQLQDQLAFLNDAVPRSSDTFYPQPDLGHRRSNSVSEVGLGSEADSFGWKPCLYYARGYCKNGTSCRFFHDSGSISGSGSDILVGSPSSKLEMMDYCQELFRSKSAQQQRLASAASQLMASSPFSYSSLAGKQSETQRALMMGEDMNKFGRFRLERNDFGMNGGPGMVNPSSRQIYLTFPADSTFREEDVSNYFSMYGPVQDVRIPYQQKRMFGFVTFVYPETVKLILAKGNPHFVCDARVLVKPYKEKGKVPDKYRKQPQQLQQIERGEFSACGSPTGLDSRDSYDLQLGARMFGNSQDILWRRKLEEQAEMEQAIELQGRRLIGLQLLDMKRPNHLRSLSSGAAISSPPTYSPSAFTQTLVLNSPQPQVTEENGSNRAKAAFENAVVDRGESPKQAACETEKEKELLAVKGTEENGNCQESSHQPQESDLPESFEHNLPDSPFASPKITGEFMTAFKEADEAEKNDKSSTNSNIIASSLPPPTSTLDMTSFKSCYFQMPRFSSGHGAVGM
ncbi:hypothetical protein NMG60_11029531 [Bertholletia excelsa]